jgi:predicted small secreted protein
MKKLLLVLMVVAMASFLLVGCLPGTTPAEGEGEGEGEGEVAPVIEVVGGYVDPDGVTYLKATGNTVKVTFSEAVADDYSVYIAKMELGGTDGITPVYTPTAGILATTTDRIVWTATVDGTALTETDCDPICLVALLKHPCCPGEEVAIKVVTVDIADPYASLLVSFEDCEETCAPSGAAKLIFTSTDDSDPCDIVSCCGDYCSGVGAWSLAIEESVCGVGCSDVTGNGCQIAGDTGCDCLVYAETGTLTYDATFTLFDKAGNKVVETWEIVVDTDEVVSFDGTTPIVFETEYTAVLGIGCEL